MKVADNELALELTREEEEAGFSLTVEPSGGRAVVLALAQGLIAVKVRGCDGGSQYAICDTTLAPLYVPAASLGELRARFQ
jgi:hypothetical protein